MKANRKQYQRPEVVQLGQASALTLGAIGCTNDGHCCQKFVVEEQ
jgi:hypothetical protein